MRPLLSLALLAALASPAGAAPLPPRRPAPSAPAPPEPDVVAFDHMLMGRYPPLEHCHQAYDLACRHHAWAGEMAEFWQHGWQARERSAWREEARLFQKFHSACEDAVNPYHSLGYRKTRLAEAEATALGLGFGAWDWPPPVPLWRFSRVD